MGQREEDDSVARAWTREKAARAHAFLDLDPLAPTYRPVAERLGDYREVTIPPSVEDVRGQAKRCMGCSVPYCHSDNGDGGGCPVNNQIPDWNGLVYKNQWHQALYDLHSTNNFPEFTGRVCPAPCEAACTLNQWDIPVTIKAIECRIIDVGFENGWVVAEPAKQKTGKKVMIVGSGPAGFACAQQLARRGHDVDVMEKNARPGGLLTYGIPDFKLEKHYVTRRVAQLEAEGVRFHTRSFIGEAEIERLTSVYDAVVLAGGAETPRDLKAPGRELGGIHFAMDYLTQENRRQAGESFTGAPILATGKDVIVIGDGDTGSDCIGTAARQGARSITQVAMKHKLPDAENKLLVWPGYPSIFRTSSSHVEADPARAFAIATEGFSGEGGLVHKLHYSEADEKRRPIPGTQAAFDANLVLLAMGFSGPVAEGMLAKLDVPLPLARAELATGKKDDYTTPVPKVFAAGDMRRGASLVVWGIREGRGAAQQVHRFLTGDNHTLNFSAHTEPNTPKGHAWYRQAVTEARP